MTERSASPGLQHRSTRRTFLGDPSEEEEQQRTVRYTALRRAAMERTERHG